MIANFTAIDFERATEDNHSICQVGMVRFRDGVPVESYGTLVYQPKFHWYTTRKVHGIRAKDVINSPKFDVVYHDIARWLTNEVIVGHSVREERRALSSAQNFYGLQPFPCFWLDSANVAERVWPEFRQQKIPYRLTSLASHFGFEHKNHDAESDARVAGQVLVKALTDAKKGLWEFQPTETDIHGQPRRQPQQARRKKLIPKMAT